MCLYEKSWEESSCSLKEKKTSEYDQTGNHFYLYTSFFLLFVFCTFFISTNDLNIMSGKGYNMKALKP